MSHLLRRHVCFAFVLSLLVACTAAATAQEKKEAPIGLQLHSNQVPQEIQWKGLELETFPEDKLLTVKE